MVKKECVINKMALKYYGPNFRGLEATEHIKKDDILMFIPNNLVITADMISSTKIGR